MQLSITADVIHLFAFVEKTFQDAIELRVD